MELNKLLLIGGFGGLALGLLILFVLDKMDDRILPIEGARTKTILVTSATPGKGKTTIAANLAITFAFSGARTLLVDAVLRLGRIAKAFKIKPTRRNARGSRRPINCPPIIMLSSIPTPRGMLTSPTVITG